MHLGGQDSADQHRDAAETGISRRKGQRPGHRIFGDTGTVTGLSASSCLAV
jgi:hypothetical protein